MYTGNPIDLENLLSNNSKYDIDHIYPRHYIKDDSLENNLVLVEKEVNNDIKGGDYPLNSEIQAKMGMFWRELVKKGFISKEKYDRLIRKTGFTEQEQADFISRQLVETRQGTKAITQILKQAFPKTRIVFSKAGVVSSFRQKYDIPKVRSLNSCHHAHDAYLNIVIGNTYYVKFTANPLNFVKEAGKHWQDPSYHYHMDKIFEYVVERNGETAWLPQSDKNPGTIKTVKNMLAKTSVLKTSKPYTQHGKITELTVYNAQTAKGKETKYLPIKTSDEKLRDISKYGGMTSIATAAYALVQYTVKGKSIDKNKTVRALLGVPVYLGIKSKDNERLYSYLTQKVISNGKKKTIDAFSIRMYPIRLGNPIIVNGFKYLLQGVTDNSIYLKDFETLYLSHDNMVYLKKIEKAVNKGDYSEMNNGQEVITESKNRALYEELTGKLKNSIYKNKIQTSITGILTNGWNVFSSLSVEQQCDVICQIIAWFNTARQNVDLLLLKESGGTAHSGKLILKNTISDYDEVLLIENSPTGLYEKKVNLLRI